MQSQNYDFNLWVMILTVRFRELTFNSRNLERYVGNHRTVSSWWHCATTYSWRSLCCYDGSDQQMSHLGGLRSNINEEKWERLPKWGTSCWFHYSVGLGFTCILLSHLTSPTSNYHLIWFDFSRMLRRWKGDLLIASGMLRLWQDSWFHPHYPDLLVYETKPTGWSQWWSHNEELG